ncbi:MAG TPA: class I adenylate-forming enzyme family protein [Jatrophihabitans sp.]|nr:class I adenylate-forming enzyme family protein [Jatrophihabitans sp.]
MTATLMHHLLDDAAAEHPDAVAVARAGSEPAGGPAQLTYAELAAAGGRIAGWLARRGVRRGDRVLLVLPNDPLVLALAYGCSRIGAVFSILNDQTVILTHYLDDAEPALVVVTDPHRAAAATGERGIALAGLAEVADVALGRAGVPGELPGPPLAVDPVCLIYTSGSTGMPKAVVTTHAQLVFAATAIQSRLDYRPTDVVYCPLPLSFDYGMYQFLLTPQAGARLQLGRPGDAGPTLLRSLADCGATVLPAVPSLAAGLARLLSRPTAARPPLRLLTNTGAAMQPEVLRELRARIPGLQVQLMFGLTECKRATIMGKDDDLSRPGACGQALPGTEVFTVDAAGHRQPPGEVGEIVVRGPNVMAGYWRRPELTEQRFPRADGLFPQLRTGDHGWLDDDGYLYFVGRRDDLYKEHGTRISVTEVEAAAHRVPGVEAAAVLPPSAGDYGATLCAVSQLGPEQVLVALRTELDDLKAPRVCHIVPEIPLSANGKVDRAGLAALIGAQPPAPAAGAEERARAGR